MFGAGFWAQFQLAGWKELPGATCVAIYNRTLSWADPACDVVHSSIVGCQANILSALRGAGVAETTSEDNLRTGRLVFAAYDSARENRVVELG
jgi:hypothetical protein